jgi:hypothetical protein
MAGLPAHGGAARTAAGRLERLFGLRGTTVLDIKRCAAAGSAPLSARHSAGCRPRAPRERDGCPHFPPDRGRWHRRPGCARQDAPIVVADFALCVRAVRRSLVAQVRMSDVNLTRAPSAGIAIVIAVLFLPQISSDSFMDGYTGACQRLPAFSLALSVSLSRRPPRAASGCMFAAAPYAAAARRAGVSDALVLSWALAKSCADGQTGAVQRRESISLPLPLCHSLLWLWRF